MSFGALWAYQKFQTLLKSHLRTVAAEITYHFEAILVIYDEHHFVMVGALLLSHRCLLELIGHALTLYSSDKKHVLSSIWGIHFL